jgi:hypothetical protein
MRLAPYKALHFDSLYGQIKSREPIASEYGFHLIVNIRRGFAEKVDCPNATIISPTIVRNSLRIPMKPATDSNIKPASHSDFIPAGVPI